MLKVILIKKAQEYMHERQPSANAENNSRGGNIGVAARASAQVNANAASE